MTRDIKIELNKPYGKEPRDAQAVQVTIREGRTYEGEGYQIQLHLQLTEALQLMRGLADALNAYRTSMQEQYSSGIEHAVSELENMFKA